MIRIQHSFQNQQFILWLFFLLQVHSICKSKILRTQLALTPGNPKFWILKHLGIQQFFNCCFRLHIKSMSGGYLGLGGFIPTGNRPLRWIIAIFRTYLYTNSIPCLLSEAFHNWLRWKMQVVEDVLLHRNKIAEFDSSNKIFFH